MMDAMSSRDAVVVPPARQWWTMLPFLVAVAVVAGLGGFAAAGSQSTYRALELPGSAASHPFGPDTEVMKVQGKLFAVFIDHDGRRLVNVKARPEDGAQLRAALPAAITPGYHMDKRHWLSLAAHPALDEQLVRDLVTESYLLVVAKLPRTRRPVDPETFGRA